MTNVFYRFPLVFILLPLALLSGCRQYQVQSCRNSGSIVIDGKDSDWPKDSFYYIEEPRVFLAVCNDDSFAYLLLRTNNTMLIYQLAERGLIVWFDPKGGGDKVLGLHYPLGLKRPGTADVRNQLDTEALPGEKRVDKPGEQKPRLGDPGQLDPERVRRMMGPVDNFKLLTKSGEKKQVIAADSAFKPGIEFKFGTAKDHYLVYELKVPLKTDQSYAYAINSANGSDYGLRLEMLKSFTGRISMKPGDQPDRPLGDGMPDEGFSGGMHGGGMPGSMLEWGPGRGPMIREENQIEFDFSARVRLSADSPLK